MKLFRIVAFACACLGASVAMAAGTLPVGPAAGDTELSAFYRGPEAMPALPGVLLRSESMPVQAQMPAAAQALRLLYSSTDERWHSGLVAVSGALYLPTGKPPAEGWPLLAWAHGTLGIADACAPSWTGLRERDAAYINRWLAHGFAVVVTDYQSLGGPGPHPYTFWQAEGRSVLDSIRAARAIRPGLIANRTFLAGQSQGGGAALGAAILADGAEQHLSPRPHFAATAPVQHRVPGAGVRRITRRRTASRRHPDRQGSPIAGGRPAGLYP
jgi:hypothetical protein